MRSILSTIQHILAEAIFKEALMREVEMKIGEKRISNISYADNTVLISDSLGRLENMLLQVAGNIIFGIIIFVIIYNIM